jgi:tRNA U34 2-thiouridine synthase MnmA/TrmU
MTDPIDPIAIAVSGGVDSLVCAYLIKRQGIDAVGIHFLTGFENPAEPGPKTSRRYSGPWTSRWSSSI